MGITEERIERIKKQAEIMESCGKAAGGMSSELGALLQDNKQMERQIELLNEANDRLRERLNRSENHDGYMKLPLDADGVPIRIGDEMYFENGTGGEPWKRTVAGYRASPSGKLSHFIGLTGVRNSTETCTAHLWSHKKPEPADSWEKLEEDAKKRSCSYFDIDQDAASCDDCPHGSRRTGTACWLNARLDMIARAKKLAGIEEEER